MASFFFLAAAELALNLKLSFPVSRASHCPPLVRGQWRAQRWVRRSSKAVVILASPKTLAHSLKLRLVVMRCLTGECAEIAEKDDAGAFVKLAQQMEEQGAARGAER